MMAGDHNIVELLEAYTKKSGIYDDAAKDHIVRLKQYRSNLDLLDKKFVTLAMNNSWLI